MSQRKSPGGALGLTQILPSHMWARALLAQGRHRHVGPLTTFDRQSLAVVSHRSECDLLNRRRVGAHSADSVTDAIGGE